MQRVLTDSEIEPLFEPYRPEDAGWIVDKTEIVKYADDSFLEVLLSTEEVKQFPKLLAVELDRQCIDGKIPAVDVVADGAGFHLGQRRRKLVYLEAGGSDINSEAVRQNDDAGLKLLVYAGTSSQGSG